MNFLAHVYLSGKNVPLAVGNLIADRVKGNTLDGFPPVIQKGILLHRKIDHFTDHHENFKACVQLLFPVYRHYSRVIVDMYFDHLEIVIKTISDCENNGQDIKKYLESDISLKDFKRYN